MHHVYMHPRYMYPETISLDQQEIVKIIHFSFLRGGEADELSGYWVLGRLGGGGWSCLTAFKLASPTAHLLMMLCYVPSTPAIQSS